MYKLRKINYAEKSKYTVNLEKDGDVIAAMCEVKEIESDTIEGLELISFESSRFDDLCIKGLVDLRLLRAAIFSFHRCA